MLSRSVERTASVYHKSILADLLTPVSAFLRISRETDAGFLLESVEGGEKIGRYSFLGVNPSRRFVGSFNEFRQSFPERREHSADLPPFTGGAVALFSYELVRELEQIPALPKTGLPLKPAVTADFYSTVLAFDHLKHQIVIMSHESAEAVLEMERRLKLPLLEDTVREPFRRRSEPVCNFTQEDFCQAVLSSKEYIRRGDIFQVVLSQRYQLSVEGDPFEVYRALRFVNPSPYLFFLRTDSAAVVGSSPEMLLKVEGRDLSYRPIAGTRRRGRNPEEEARLEAELLADEKERAEHIMLVDLGRNDLGRVCEFGTVSVEGLLFLEKYSHVFHLVSSLRGRLRKGLDRFDALAACFPAGTVTGAPKVRAMEIIEELEPCHRGIYAGAIGYLDFSGNLDSCIAIRTLVFENGQVQLQAGAGLVADSVPELEFKECQNKARALFHAMELAENL